MNQNPFVVRFQNALVDSILDLRKDSITAFGIDINFFRNGSWSSST